MVIKDFSKDKVVYVMYPLPIDCKGKRRRKRKIFSFLGWKQFRLGYYGGWCKIPSVIFTVDGNTIFFILQENK